MIAVLATGVVCFALAFVNLPIERFDLKFVLLFCLTIGFASRVTVPIPRIKSHIAVSDTFIFLMLLMYGGEYAVIVAAVEAFASSWRFCNRKITVFFNAAIMVISSSTVVLVLKALGLYEVSQAHGPIQGGQNFVSALSVIALTQFAMNTTLASVYDSLKSRIPLWETWKSKYLWTFFTSFVGIGGASVLVQLSDYIGFGILIATFPLIFFVYLSYRMYLKNIDISVKQAEQAEQYAKILESKSDELRESEERFRSAFAYAPIGIALVSPTGSWLKVNQALTQILGYSDEEFRGTNFQSMTLPEDLDQVLGKMDELLSGEIPNHQMEQRYRHKTGRTVWTSFSVSATSDSASGQPNLIFQIQDITHKKLADQQLQHEATHDALTGLPNRAFFMGRLATALKIRESTGDYSVSILFIDLDRFKYVNDSLGHLLGDELLKGIAGRLRECMRPSDLVARLGGDEFTILVEGSYDPVEVTHIAERIQQKFSIPFELDGHEVYSSASIGILHASDQHVSSEDMMRDADTAMYQAKRAGKARHEIFDETMHREAKEILRLETDLRRALERHEITVYYQPIYCLATREVECLEALARWNHPELGQIPPAKFIPLAEEIGLIDKLCEQVLRRACREVGSLKNELGVAVQLSMSVNLSCKQFARMDLVKDIEQILRQTRFSPLDLNLEITESVFFEHPESALEMLHRLREIGIGIAVDDFGTGYSNLGYLMKLPISKLKIDRSFVSMIDAAGGNDEIVRAIVLLARNLGMKVTAEGIETEAQLERLKALECESGQGFLFSAPMTFEQVRAFLKKEERFDVPAGHVDDITTTIAVIQ